jgi:hypothetical protein
MVQNLMHTLFHRTQVKQVLDPSYQAQVERIYEPIIRGDIFRLDPDPELMISAYAHCLHIKFPYPGLRMVTVADQRKVAGLHRWSITMHRINPKTHHYKGLIEDISLPADASSARIRRTLKDLLVKHDYQGFAKRWANRDY